MLDLAVASGEAWDTNPTRPKVRSDMFDPAALGTLIIGLEAIRHDERRWATDARPVRTHRRRVPTARLRLAAALRGMAARIEPAGSST